MVNTMSSKGQVAEKSGEKIIPSMMMAGQDTAEFFL